MSPRILVTGAGGVIGRAVQELIPAATCVSKRDADLRDATAAARLFQSVKPEAVLHLAERAAGVKENEMKNVELLTDNLLINTHVLSCARAAGVRRLVAVLSSCAFSFPPARPAAPEDLHVGLPFEGNLGYGYAKRVMDVQGRLISRQDGADFQTVTPATVYGPHDDFDPDRGHVVSALIRKCVDAQKEARPFTVWGDGTAVRQFIFSSDLARVLVDLIGRRGSEHVIVAADDGIPIRVLAESVARAVGFQGPIRFDPRGPVGLQKKVLKRDDAGRWRDFQFTPLADGLARTVDWYRSTLKTER